MQLKQEFFASRQMAKRKLANYERMYHYQVRF